MASFILILNAMKEAQTEALEEDDGDIRYGYICPKKYCEWHPKQFFRSVCKAKYCKRIRFSFKSLSSKSGQKIEYVDEERIKYSFLVGTNCI